MLIPMTQLISEYRIRKEGSVLHVGAHYGEEADAYWRAGFQPVYWIEADDNSLGKLRSSVARFPNNVVINAAVAECVKEVKFNVANNGQSSSILEFGTHLKEHPDVWFTNEKTLTTTTIDNLFDEGIIGPTNFMNLDIQGAELLALKGAGNYLNQVQYIYTEVNDKELYKDCVLFPELSTWLQLMGFECRAKVMTPHGWGDALFVRRGL